MDLICGIYKYIIIILCASLIIGLPIVIICSTVLQWEGWVLANAILWPLWVLIAPLFAYLGWILITD